MSRPGQKPLEGLAPQLVQFGIEIVTIKQLEGRAKSETDDLLTKLRKGGL